jgi:hypothetical protein
MAAAVPSATAIAAPTAATDAGPLGWVDIGAVKASGIDFLLPLDDGYFGWEAYGAKDYPTGWFSSDGESWTHSLLAKEITPCPGWKARPDGEVTDGATNGKAVVLVGLEYAPEATTCGDWQATAWVTSDGASWQRAPGFAAENGGNSWAHDVWATPTGWEAAITGPSGITIWQSADGLAWTQVAQVAKPESSIGAHASGPDGTRLLVIGDDQTETSRLLASTNGRDWLDADRLPMSPREIAHIQAPEEGSRRWIVVTSDEGGDRSAVWTSTDLKDWDGGPFPMPSVEGIKDTTYGLLAFGADPCHDTGGPCETDPSEYFLSPDGKAWAPLDAAVAAVTFVEGRAGVVGIGAFDPKAEGGAKRVWRLEPYSAAEAVLFSGMRPDARFACAARRTGLPAHALAGVECSPHVAGVDRIGAYLFGQQDEMVDAYLQRLADNGVKPRSGSCPKRAGETSYVPEQAALSPYRYGCFLNEFGNANYRFTVPDDRVYVGVLGTDESWKRLHDWAWRGNQDTPGSPTVWRAPVP